jgi:hypothetical protein
MIFHPPSLSHWQLESKWPNTALEPTASPASIEALSQSGACMFSGRGSAFGSGFVRVTVATDKITLNYVKSFPGTSVADSYTVTTK